MKKTNIRPGKTRCNLSLGCGERQEEGYIGLDSRDYGHNVIWCAPDKIPYDDNTIDFIKAHNFFEHLYSAEVIITLNECWRILKPEGLIEIEVPNVHHTDNAFTDITHVSYWTTGTFENLTGKRPRNADYGILNWEMKKINLRKNNKSIKAVLSPKK